MLFRKYCTRISITSEDVIKFIKEEMTYQFYFQEKLSIIDKIISMFTITLCIGTFV